MTALIHHFDNVTDADSPLDIVPVAGRIGATSVLVLTGRLHLYEGHPADVVALPIRLCRALGAEIVVLTNAAGGIRSTLLPGT